MTYTPLRATLQVAALILTLAIAFPVERLAAAPSALILLLPILASLALVRLKRQGSTCQGIPLPLAVPAAAAFLSPVFLVLGLAGLLT
jgi:hypothetical protein